MLRWMLLQHELGRPFPGPDCRRDPVLAYWSILRHPMVKPVATTLTPAQMKQFVRDHFEEFVNKRNATVIRKNMTPGFYDHDGPGGKPERGGSGLRRDRNQLTTDSAKQIGIPNSLSSVRCVSMFMKR
jgi:hypothetical protein